MKVLNSLASAIGWMFIGLFALGFIGTAVGIGLYLSKGDNGMEEAKTSSAVGVVELTGEIMTSEKFEKDLDRLVKNDKMKGIVVRIDSPGGAVGASEEIFTAIRNADKKKPVVCSLGSIAASGGLFSAVGCRKIVANKGTLTGSIGVIMMTPQLGSIMEKVGVAMTVVKSGHFKDAGSPFRELQPDERALLETLVADAHTQFIELIANARNIPVDKVRSFADGRIILGEKAVELGLVDEIGSLARAAKLALELANIKDTEPEIIRPSKPSGLLAFFNEMPDSMMPWWFRQSSATQLLYRAAF